MGTHKHCSDGGRELERLGFNGISYTAESKGAPCCCKPKLESSSTKEDC